MGNPPYLGSRRQDEEQKTDMEIIFHRDYGNLDYISCWFMKGAEYINETSSKCGFVSTNSICQGEQVSLLWKRILSYNVEIEFAYTSFKWSNNAKYNAGVTVIVVGLASCSKKQKVLYKEDKGYPAHNISPYLMDAPTRIVESSNLPQEGFPIMNFGNMPADGGCLLFDDFQKNEFIEKQPEAEQFIKPLIGADDFINRKNRWCLWLNHVPESDFIHLPLVKERVDRLRVVREKSSRPQLAAIPHLFAQITQPENTSFILIPRHSSENREYIPMGFFDKGNVAADSCMVIGTKDRWLFGILTSAMHMAWVRAIGGRLKTDYRYSAGLCYNPFPFPRLTEAKKKEIEDAAWEVLGAREAHYGKTLAELYDPETMPQDLRDAHHQLDLIVDSCYRDRPFADENERLEWLLKLYDRMTN